MVGVVFDAITLKRRDAGITERLRSMGVRQDVIVKALGTDNTQREPTRIDTVDRGSLNAQA